MYLKNHYPQPPPPPPQTPVPFLCGVCDPVTDIHMLNQKQHSGPRTGEQRLVGKEGNI